MNTFAPVVSTHNQATRLPLAEETITQFLQKRIIRLLFLLDKHEFDKLYRTFFAGTDLPRMHTLEQYVRYIRLFTCSDELLDDIMPRIRRQLRLQSHKLLLYEEAPTRGTIDWQRSLQRTWNTTPGEPPRRFDTRWRQRTIASYENMFTVAVLHYYHETLKHLLNTEFADEPLLKAERHILADMAERVEREQAEPYVRMLLSETKTADIETCAEQLELHMRPGPGPYRDLLFWWEKFSSLRIGSMGRQQSLAIMSRQEAERQNQWLYKLWFALELIHMLRQKQCITKLHSFTAYEISCTFTWNKVSLRFTYTRQAETERFSSWENAPYIHALCTITRTEGLRVPRDIQKPLIWREPPIILETDYTFHTDNHTATDAPLQHLIGDMTVLEAEQGILFFPSLPPTQQGHHEMKRRATNNNEHMRPYYAGMNENFSVQFHELRPDPTHTTHVPLCLSTALDTVEKILSARKSIDCQGIWLDLSTLDTNTVIDKDTEARKRNSSVADEMGKIIHNIICPKPHIGRSVFDFVHNERDCLRNEHLCHIIGDGTLLPPAPRSSATLEDLIHNTLTYRISVEAALQQVETFDDDDKTELLYNRTIATLARSIHFYTKKSKLNRKVHEDMLPLIFGDRWSKDEKYSLSPKTRDMLIIGQCMWYEFIEAEISFDDWSIAGIMYCRALEHELKGRLYYPVKDDFEYIREDQWTLGKPISIFNAQYYPRGRNNWATLKNRFVEKEAPITQEDTATFFIESLNKMKEIRNALAHGAPVSLEDVIPMHDALTQSNELLYWVLHNVKPPSIL